MLPGIKLQRHQKKQAWQAWYPNAVPASRFVTWGGPQSIADTEDEALNIVIDWLHARYLEFNSDAEAK